MPAVVIPGVVSGPPIDSTVTTAAITLHTRRARVVTCSRAASKPQPAAAAGALTRITVAALTRSRAGSIDVGSSSSILSDRTGLRTLREAQDTHYAGLQRRLFSRLDWADINTLVRLTDRILAGPRPETTTVRGYRRPISMTHQTRIHDDVRVPRRRRTVVLQANYDSAPLRDSALLASQRRPRSSCFCALGVQ